jgi:DNA-binding GntR family transcriptional regulator
MVEQILADTRFGDRVGEARGLHVESAYEDLRALILQGVLRPGDPIREGPVAAR